MTTGYQELAQDWAEEFKWVFYIHNQDKQKLNKLNMQLIKCKTTTYDRIGSSGTPTMDEEDRLADVIDKINKLKHKIEYNKKMFNLYYRTSNKLNEIQGAIFESLVRSEMSKNRIAEGLSISRTTLYRHIDEIEIVLFETLTEIVVEMKKKMKSSK